MAPSSQLAELTTISEKIRDHLIEQRQCSIGATQECLYRGPHGIKCAVGFLISDALYDPTIEDQQADATPVFKLVLESLGLTNAPTLMQKQLCNLMMQWQSYHDQTPVDTIDPTQDPLYYSSWLAGDVTHSPSLQHQLVIGRVRDQLNDAADSAEDRIAERTSKQVIVIRKDLKMPAGKALAQVAHASMAAVLNLMNSERDGDAYSKSLNLNLESETDAAVHDWLEGAFTKIVVWVDNEADLDRLYNQAIEQNIVRSCIIDSGYTVFNGVPTKTCCAFGPAPNDVLDNLTGHLKLVNKL